MVVRWVGQIVQWDDHHNVVAFLKPLDVDFKICLPVITIGYKIEVVLQSLSNMYRYKIVGHIVVASSNNFSLSGPTCCAVLTKFPF